MDFSFYSGFAVMYQQHGIHATANFAKSHGFSAVEMFYNAISPRENSVPENPAKASADKKVLNGHGLEVCCYSVYTDVRDEGCQRNLMNQVEIAAALGSPFFHHTVLPHSRPETDSDYAEAVKIAVDVSAAVADKAVKYGITCIYEDQGFYVNGVKGFSGFFRQMKEVCKNVGVCADFGNIFYTDENAGPFFKAFQDDICHVHAKDYLRQQVAVSPGAGWNRTLHGNWLKDVAVGNGVVDTAECMAILNQIGYSGKFSLEVPPTEENIRSSMQVLQRLYNPAI